MKLETMVGLFVVALVIALIVVGPLAVIWSLNTLFGLSIAYTFKTWLATMILSATITPNIKLNKEK